MSLALSAEELEKRRARRLNGETVKPPVRIEPEPEPEPEPVKPASEVLAEALGQFAVRLPDPANLARTIETQAEMNRNALSVLAEKLSSLGEKREYVATFVRNEKGLIVEATLKPL
jgi:hypothetical protein